MLTWLDAPDDGEGAGAEEGGGAVVGMELRLAVAGDGGGQAGCARLPWPLPLAFFFAIASGATAGRYRGGLERGEGEAEGTSGQACEAGGQRRRTTTENG